ncbi:MAG: McrB family protein, partial [Desulfurispora sp.]
MLTAENCLIMKVNNHNRGYDGNICDKPRKHACGASDYFRANYCALQIRQCYELSLFDVAHPSFYKRGRDVDVDGYVSELYRACQQGQNPLIFFYTTSGRRNILTGLYVVGQVERERYLVSFGGDDWKYTFTPLEGWALRFPDPRPDNDFLWHHTEGSRGSCHRVNRNYVATGLGILIDMYSEALARMNLEPGLRLEREKILPKLRELLEKLVPGTPAVPDLAGPAAGPAVAGRRSRVTAIAGRPGKG